MPSQSDESYIATLYESPILLRDALKSLAIKYLEVKSLSDDVLLRTYKRASHPAFQDDYQPVEGNGFFMGDPEQIRYNPGPKVHGVSPKTVAVLMNSLRRRFDDAVRCLASHKADGWYEAVGRNIVTEIDRAYATQDNNPLKALDRVAPMLANLKPPSPTPPPQPKGPLL